MSKDYIVSVASILNNDSVTVEDFLKETTAILSESYKNYEIVLVDNGSTDDTASVIKELQKNYKNVRLISLSKRYDTENAQIAALDNSIGDFVVLMDINMDPPNLIPEMITKCVSGSGYDLIIGERNNRKDDAIVERAAARLFYKLSSVLTDYPINPNFSDYVCYSRKVVNSLIQIRNRSRYLKYLKLEVGYKYSTVKFDRIKRGGKKRKRSLVNEIGFAIEVLVTNSDKLLRWSSFIGLTISVVNLFYMAYIFIIAVFKDTVAEGWTSSSFMNSFMFFALFLILSIISIYMSSVLKESKKGALYYISEETNSSVIYKEIDKKNIV